MIRQGDRWAKTAATLALGYLAVTGAIAVAYLSPATAHELSPYIESPTGFWVGLGFALAVSLLVSFSAGPASLRLAGVGLGGLATVSAFALPLLRNYHFYGMYDSLTHLGWARDLQTGSMTSADLFYPGIHSVAVTIRLLTGLSLTRSVLVMVVCFVVVFFLFVPLTVAALVPGHESVVVGAFSAFLLLPITHMSTHPHTHAMTQTILLSTALVYLLVRYLSTSTDHPLHGPLTALMVVFSAALVIYHPQLAAHVLVVLVAIVALQWAVRLLPRVAARLRQPSVGGHVVFLAGWFVLWGSVHGLFEGIAYRATVSVIEYLTGRSTEQAAESVGTQSASLAAIGATVEEVFLKLFAVSLLFCALTALAVGLVLFRDRLSLGGVDRPGVLYLGVALASLVPVFAFYYVSTLSEMYFRVFGLQMLFVTVLGAVGVVLSIRLASTRLSRAHVTGAVGVLFACLLVLSLVVFFPSPYVYLQSPHVTEQQMHGHRVAFDNQQEGVEFVGIRGGPARYTDAIHGGGRTDLNQEEVPREALHGGISSHFDGDRYVVVTEIDEHREAKAFKGLRYGSEDFAAVESQVGLQKIHTNGEFDLYYAADDDPAEGASTTTEDG
ncbi:hypothetical protein [Natronorarus salvus]|uniref:hypothetical protein n=1 Tax=Natronorarus salvus TaxID=3117733 RepID=UPI002F26D365